MRLFLKKFLLFSLPIAIIILFPFIFFYLSKEFISTDKIMEGQLSDKPIIIGKILPYWFKQYSKLDIIKIKKPAVITLGNSRVLQIRSKFFKKNNFFNGGGIGNLTGLKEILNKLNDEEKPKIIIIGLEQSYFNPFSDNHEIPDLAMENNNSNLPIYILNSWRRVYFNIFSGKYTFSQLLSSYDDNILRIGLQATAKNAGMRNDGSYNYGNIYDIDDKKNEDYKFNDTLRRMEKGINLFYHGDKISDKSISILIDFLDYCKKRKIYVIGFLPPYAQEIHDKMKSSGEYGYVFDLEKKLKPIFKNYNYDFYNFSDMKSFGAEKNEIVDGLHASEKAYLRLFIAMTKNNHTLREYASNADILNSMLNTETTR